MHHEIYLPTLTHHLGYRVCSMADGEEWVSNLGDFRGRIRKARNEGAWTIHPVKSLTGLRWGEE